MVPLNTDVLEIFAVPVAICRLNESNDCFIFFEGGPADIVAVLT